ncbi:transglycosylase domain-containing protein [Rubidibacter lacunae]|uniref:transglycosylase domain-containing protein n=1 Tax=Rubidibacter lacunae TaxID=582514 RepID=UPI0038CD4FAD
MGFTGGVVRVTFGTFVCLTLLTTSAVAGGLVGLALSFRNLPDVRVLSKYAPAETSYIYDVKGRLLLRLHAEANREVVLLPDISDELKLAVLAIEDSHFYHHQGINPTSVARAGVVNYRSGGVVEGASTITLQLVKNLFLTPDRTVSRKLAEAVLALRIEQIFEKDEILELYLNAIYWGHNNYGVETAALTYFQKSSSELNLAESAMMAGLIQLPEIYSPFNNYDETKRRQLVVLDRMRDLGWITAEEASQAYREPLLIGRPTAWERSKLPFVTDAVTQELEQRFGREVLLEGGLRVQTTVDFDFQRMAESVVKNAHQGLRDRGLNADQVALVAVDPRTHFIKAIVGSVDYESSQYNRVLQARRQPGSSFKPFVYYTAFSTGVYDPDSIVEDTPVSYRDGSNYYSPRNYGGNFSGPVPIRTALAQSSNVPVVKLGQEIGLDNVINVVRELGIESPLQPVVSLPLGSIGVTPLEMVGAYATFANGGWHDETSIIVRVTDSSGNVLYENQPQPRLLLDPWAVASLNSVLQTAVESGTGTNGRIPGRPVAGKTGTTTSERDVWFIGYTPQLAAAVWIGNDDYRPLGVGITGGGYAAPVWRSFVEQALANEPVLNFPPPSAFPRPEKSE